jgi:glycosyltransferase involved in cell wall biosynthesis
MSGSPAVSVLVPCFRSAAYLQRALDSIAAQTFQDWEAVVVDNSSDDGTHELALRYAAGDGRFRVHRNAENLGPVLNWRRCVALARGRVAGFLFSDDWYAREFLADAVPFLDDRRTAFVYSAVRIVEDLSRPGDALLYYALGGSGVRSTREFLRGAYGLVRDVETPVSPGCALFRTAELSRWLSADLPGGETYRWLAHGAGPDVLVYLQACLERPRFVHLAEPRVFFLSHDGNLTWRPEVGRAYAVALAEFLARAAPRLGLAAELARAKLVDRLHAVGEAERSRELERRLGLIGRLSLRRERQLAARASIREQGGA